MAFTTGVPGVDHGDVGSSRFFLGSEKLGKIKGSRILTRLPTSEIARGLFRLTRARRYQISVREFVTVVGGVTRLILHKTLRVRIQLFSF